MNEDSGGARTSPAQFGQSLGCERKDRGSRQRALAVEVYRETLSGTWGCRHLADGRDDASKIWLASQQETKRKRRVRRSGRETMPGQTEPMFNRAGHPEGDRLAAEGSRALPTTPWSYQGPCLIWPFWWPDGILQRQSTGEAARQSTANQGIMVWHEWCGVGQGNSTPEHCEQNTTVQPKPQLGAVHCSLSEDARLSADDRPSRSAGARSDGPDDPGAATSGEEGFFDVGPKLDPAIRVWRGPGLGPGRLPDWPAQTALLF